ncbi:hypothetical protein N9095_01280 [bacterium]|nr:hypothetical protein [bacterium]
MPVLDEVLGRLELGRKRYGHGVRANDDTRTWGTSKNSWMEMAREEFLDALVYITADYIVEGRKTPPNRMSDLEQKYIELDNSTRSDDNNVIMYILENVESMPDCRHKHMLIIIFSILKTC